MFYIKQIPPRSLVKKVSSATYEEFEDFLKSVELLSTLSNSERAKITGALEQKHYPVTLISDLVVLTFE